MNLMNTPHTPVDAQGEMREALRWIVNAPLGKITHQEFIETAQRISKAVLEREANAVVQRSINLSAPTLLSQRNKLREALKATLEALATFTAGRVHFPTAFPEVEQQARAALNHAKD